VGTVNSGGFFYKKYPIDVGNGGWCSCPGSVSCIRGSRGGKTQKIMRQGESQGRRSGTDSPSSQPIVGSFSFQVVWVSISRGETR